MDLLFASAALVGGAWCVQITHPSYNGGGVISVTQYASEEGALEGAAWWDAFMQDSSPAELVDLSGPRYARTE